MSSNDSGTGSTPLTGDTVQKLGLPSGGNVGSNDAAATTKGKYLLLMVPNFAYDPVPVQISKDPSAEELADQAEEETEAERKETNEIGPQEVLDENAEEPTAQQEAKDAAAKSYTETKAEEEAEQNRLDPVIPDTGQCCDERFEQPPERHAKRQGDYEKRKVRREQAKTAAETRTPPTQTPTTNQTPPQRPMTSFLRLGVFHENWWQQPGGQLAALAFEVPTGQGGHLNPKYGGEVDTTLHPSGKISGATPFLDDLRHRDGSDGTLPVDRRLQESKHLFDRGGWWDHSDGNRISTTYGDKVEVIRGSYKMVVMGRQDDPDLGGGWDHSGGHIQDLGPNMMPGASVRVEYRKDKHTGQWHLENQTNNFIQTSDYAGDFFEHWYGNKIYTTIGSEEPREYSKEKEKPLGNPHLLDKTWACKIESYTGSAAWRIPRIIDHTHARQIEELTDVSGEIKSTTRAGAIHEETIVGAAIRSETKAGSISESTDVAAGIRSETKANSITEITHTGALTSISNVGAITEITTAGALSSVTTAAVSANVETIGVKLDVVIGHRSEIQIPKDNKVTKEHLNTVLSFLQQATLMTVIVPLYLMSGKKGQIDFSRLDLC